MEVIYVHISNKEVMCHILIKWYNHKCIYILLYEMQSSSSGRNKCGSAGEYFNLLRDIIIMSDYFKSRYLFFVSVKFKSA